MANLIIGHVSSAQTRIWVRGDRERPYAWVALGRQKPKMMRLQDRHYYTGVMPFENLKSDARYTCRLWLTHQAVAPNKSEVPLALGHFRTPPEGPAAFTFMLGSCNGPSLWGATRPNRMWSRVDLVADACKAAFMIHCGDQIYADMPPAMDIRSYDLPHYREKYVKAWDRDEAKRVFARMGHYMILDDHEILNDFAADMELDKVPVEWLAAVAEKAYREFQHVKNPQTFGSSALYYHFEWAHARFFVLDTRTERLNKAKEIIGRQQMGRLKEWLLAGDSKGLKFVVSSVPFVGEIKTSPDDKWTGFPQREELIDFIFENKLHNIFILTGDMHNAYNAKMTIKKGPQSLVVRELMSSPLNQLFKAGQWAYRMETDFVKTPGGANFRTEVSPESFYGEHSLVSTIEVTEQSVTMNYHRTKKDEGTGVGPFVMPLES